MSEFLYLFIQSKLQMYAVEIERAVTKISAPISDVA